MKHAVKKGDKPAYLQLYEQLRDAIVRGYYEYDKKIPSKRVLANEVGVSVVTVEHAYQLLCDEGYLEARERSGYFAIFRPYDEFDAPLTRRNESSFIKALSTVDSDFPFSVFAKTVRRVLSERGESVLERSPNWGCVELRETLKNYLARNYNLFVDVGQIVIGAGAEYLYRLLIDLLGRQRVYAIESPSYNKIEQTYRASETTYTTLPLEQDGINSSALWACEADVLHVSPYRSFPSGVTATPSKRHEYLRWAGVCDRFVVEDNFESEFSLATRKRETLFSLTRQENVVHMNTFSKTISPALRVGYMVLPNRLVSAFEKKLSFYSCPVPTLIQYSLAELIANGDFERHINRTRRRLRKQRIEMGNESY